MEMRLLLRIFVSLILSIVSILIYFHIQCLEEKENSEESSFSDYYDPNEVDCEVQMPFVKNDRQSINTFLGLFNQWYFQTNLTHILGLEFILIQWAPCLVIKLISILNFVLYGDQITLDAYEYKNVTIMDARNHKTGSFSETGFTLLHLDSLPNINNWGYGSGEMKIFQQQIEPYLYELYPETKKVLWLTNLVRGGKTPGHLPISTTQNR